MLSKRHIMRTTNANHIGNLKFSSSHLERAKQKKPILIFYLTWLIHRYYFDLKNDDILHFFVLSLQSLVCIGYLQHVSTQTSHILNAVQSYVASGYIISSLFF